MTKLGHTTLPVCLKLYTGVDVGVGVVPVLRQLQLPHEGRGLGVVVHEPRASNLLHLMSEVEKKVKALKFAC